MADGFMDKIKDFVKGNPEQAGGAIDKVEDLVDERTGGKYSEQIDKGTDALREQLGLPPEQSIPVPGEPAPGPTPVPEPGPTPVPEPGPTPMPEPGPTPARPTLRVAPRGRHRSPRVARPSRASSSPAHRTRAGTSPTRAAPSSGSTGTGPARTERGAAGCGSAMQSPGGRDPSGPLASAVWRMPPGSVLEVGQTVTNGAVIADIKD